MNIEQMRANIAYVESELVRLHESAGDNPMSDENQTRFDEGVAYVDTARQELERAIAQNQIVERIRTAPASVLPSGTVTDTVEDPLGQPDSIRDDARVWDLDRVAEQMRANPEQGLGELRGNALDAVERAAGLDDRQKEHVTRFVESLDHAADDETQGARRVAAHIIATSSPEYQRAWARALKSAVRHGQADQASLGVLQRAMSLTDAAGGYAVPLPVDPTLIPNFDGTVNPFREIATVRTIVTDALRSVNSTGATFSWDGEAAEVSDDSTTFGNVDITAYKAQGLIPFSIEISEDYPGFTADIRMLIAAGRDDLEAAAFATGTGTNQPFGIVTALTGTSSVVASAAADTFAVGDLYAVEEALPAKFRARASWVANKSTYNDVRQFGVSDGHALWERIGAGQPAQLLGYNAYEASEMDGTIDAAADNYTMVLGDWSNYWIADRVGLSMELVPHMFATGANRPNGQRAFYVYWRVGADSVNDRAFRMLNVT